MSTRSIASGGSSRISPKPEMRWPFRRMTGWPPCRPRPERVCGASASTSSPIEVAP
jgi:hypothetical protein